jgi:eukaryotic-like serine/threonine-protein kinase
MTEQELFVKVLQEAAPEQRLEYLNKICGGDIALRERVATLLTAHAGAAGGFLESPAAGPPATIDFEPLREGPGAVVGPYKLLQKIGEGGFGVVYMAQQEQPVRRQVALKIIKAGMDTREVIARFESERQALAVMDHPHIAKILDAGATLSGRPYFVMELVKGVPITEFCDRNHLPPEARLKLFIDVCHAIQHAHHKGIIHRDVKPGNVLVTLHDGVPVVKVIDFGVAKATIQRLTERTLFTAFGQMVGTPVYMSPEQAEMSGLDIDTRTDVYSLGVLLYELLTGTTPLDLQRLRAAGYAEMQRLIREEEPPTPSHRISSLGDSATILAGNRGTDARRLARQLSGDLDCVVLKALEKDRNRRYATPGNFAEDIQRYLHREPIVARPPSAMYKLRKFSQRNRAAVITAASLLLLLLAGITGTTWGLLRAEHRRQEADKARVNESRQLQIARAEKRRAEQAEVETLAAYREATNDVVGQLLAERPELGPGEKQYLENTLKRWQSFAERNGDDERSRAIRAEGHSHVALFLQRLDRKAESRVEWQEAVRMYRKLVDEFPQAREYPRQLAICYSNLGVLAMEEGDRERAWNESQQCRDLIAQMEPSTASDEQVQVLLASVLGNQAVLLKQQGKFAAARQEYQLSGEIFDRLTQQFTDKPKYRQNLANVHNNQGMLFVAERDDDAAWIEFQAALKIQQELADRFPANSTCLQHLARTRGHLADLLARRGDRAAALAEYDSATTLLKDLAEQLPGVASYAFDLAIHCHNQGMRLRAWGRRNDARAAYEQALKAEQQLIRRFPDAPQYQALLAQTQTNLGNLLGDLSQREEAISLFQSARDTLEQLVRRFPQPEYRQRLGQAHTKLGLRLHELNKLVEARAEHELAMKTLEPLVAQHSDVVDYQVDLGGSYCNYAKFLLDGDKASESLKWFDLAVTTLETAYAKQQRGQVREYLVICRVQRAMAYHELEKLTEALADFDRAIELSAPADQADLRADRAALAAEKATQDAKSRQAPDNR